MLPLDNIRVLDLTHLTVGPFCTRVLADYGADVIKIERPGGDPARMLPPFPGDEPHPERSGTFLALNTAKRSVVLDLKSEQGRNIALRLAAGADVVVDNFSPGTIDRLGLGYEALREANPRLVYTSITNFGTTGPYRDWEGTDLTLFAMGGAMIGQGHLDHEPVKLGGRAAGYQAGYAAALASAMGVVAAEQRGSGEQLEVSIFETLLQSIDLRLGRLMGFQHNGIEAYRSGAGLGVGSGTLPCIDGYVLITSGPARLPSTMRMIGREDLLERPEWATVESRSDPDRIPEFDQYLLEWTITKTKEEVRAACQEHGVLGGPLNTTADLLQDRNFVHRKFFQEIDHPETGPLTYPGYQVTFHTDPPREPRRRAPLLGEHTREVLEGELGLSPEELADLEASGVIALGKEAADAGAR